jgi:hypothetical protein
VSHLLRGTDPECLHLLDADPTSLQSTAPATAVSPTLKLLVRCLTPTLPSNRFYHLLNKKRFDEAAEVLEYTFAFGVWLFLTNADRVW